MFCHKKLAPFSTACFVERFKPTVSVPSAETIREEKSAAISRTDRSLEQFWFRKTCKTLSGFSFSYERILLHAIVNEMSLGLNYWSD